jgi:hypothetical protein
MGWITEGAYGHEGWVADVLADGRVASGSTGGGVVLFELTAEDVAAGWEVRRYPGSDHVDVVVPWDQVVTWRATCACGWTGPSLPAVDDPDGTRHCPDDVEEREFRPAWQAHVAPHAALAELGELAGRLREVERRIAEKVRLARAGDASWSDIGRAAGLSTQDAQRRWGGHVDVDVDSGSALSSAARGSRAGTTDGY